MKAIILAAGMGTRLNKYTQTIPKGMLPINGQPILKHQIQMLRRVGLEDIIIVTGYKKNAINFSGIRYCHNPDYASTNMITSLMCASSEFNTDVLVTYSDVLVSLEHLKLIAGTPEDFAVLVDKNWRDYWTMRYGTTENDLETMEINKNGEITNIGRPVNDSTLIESRYVGVNKFSKKGIDTLYSLYNKKAEQAASWDQSKNEFKQGYMTDIIQEIINNGHRVKAIAIEDGWVEIDTVKDYEQLTTEREGIKKFTSIVRSLKNDEMRNVHRLLNHSYSDYSSVDYHDQYRKNREEFLNRFKQERDEFEQRIVGEVSSDARLICDHCLSNIPQRATDGSFDTFYFLVTLIKNYFITGTFSGTDLQALRTLQKKMAVFHRIFSMYDNMMNKIDSSFQSTEIYALLSIAHSIRFERQQNYNDLNTTLCVNDILVGSGWLIKPTYRPLIYCAIKIELNLINHLYDESIS